MTNPLFLAVKGDEIPHIDYQHNLLVIGSCFADNIGQRMIKAKMQVCVNPWGILYNPISIAQNLLRAVNQNQFEPNELFFSDELYQSWNHHGMFSGTNATEVLEEINRTHFEASEAIKQENGTLIITLGSAWVYEFDGQIVANCHKVSASKFEKRLLNIDEIETAYDQLIKQLSASNKIIFTVSPVRYKRDGLHNSQLSKAVLHLSIHRLQQKHKNVHYFPAYEILIDELRDYRFYAEDLVHPSDTAIQIIWERFVSQNFTDKSQKILLKINAINRDLNHRLLFPETSASKRFLWQLIEKMKAFELETGIKMEHEIQSVNSQM